MEGCARLANGLRAPRRPTVEVVRRRIYNWSAMTKLMEQAVRHLQALPDDRQDQIAGFVISELREEDNWLRSTAAHAAGLQKLVDGVLDAERRGECGHLDPDRL
jgi:hypothetical protein